MPPEGFGDSIRFPRGESVVVVEHEPVWVVGLADGGGSTIINRDVLSCVQGAISRIKFTPWEGKAVSALLPIDFVAPELTARFGARTAQGRTAVEVR